MKRKGQAAHCLSLSNLVIPHMSFPVLIRCLIIGEPDAGNILTVQDGEIGLLGDLTQLPVMVEEGGGDHNGEYSIRIFGFDLRFLSRGGLQQLVHARDRTEDPILLSFDILIGSCITHISITNIMIRTVCSIQRNLQKPMS